MSNMNKTTTTTTTTTKGRIAALEEKVMQLEAMIDTLLSAKRQNTTTRITSGAPLVSVGHGSVRILAGARALLSAQFTPYVTFRDTNINGMYALCFHFTQVPGAEKVTEMSANSTWAICSNNVVNAVFGGPNIGSPSVTYNAAACPGAENTLLVWPATLEFLLGRTKVVLGKRINTTPRAKTPRMSVVRGRIRFNSALLSLVGAPGDLPYATVKTVVSGQTYDITFSDVQASDSYVLTHDQNSTVGTYAICSNTLIGALGLDPKKPTSKWSAKKVGKRTVRVTIEKAAPVVVAAA